MERCPCFPVCSICPLSPPPLTPACLGGLLLLVIYLINVTPPPIPLLTSQPLPQLAQTQVSTQTQVSANPGERANTGEHKHSMSVAEPLGVKASDAEVGGALGQYWIRLQSETARRAWQNQTGPVQTLPAPARMPPKSADVSDPETVTSTRNRNLDAQLRPRPCSRDLHPQPLSHLPECHSLIAQRNTLPAIPGDYQRLTSM
ncbi:uncharacterized protein LOC113580851 [Electrophorus electricus]|uniref:uncharacterized protein LOC113580851 n=1 Tax=Electrophorus electricus TaxID=8005 RepID=UPI0015D00297|nr:uncharacterized protein LOC113580851 [Electrophorus electricus]